jgi:hypothetical protein
MKSQNNKLINFFRELIKRIDWKCVGAVLLAFIVTRAMIMIVTYFSMAQIPIRTDGAFWNYNPRNLIPNGLVRWDSGFYLNIAEGGYVGTSPQVKPFFPLYPLFMRLLLPITGNYFRSGLLVSNISFLIALFYFYALTKDEFDEGTAGRAVFYIAAAPTAFFFSALYTESLFLLFLTACFYYSRNGKWLLAAIAGALASATRPLGVLVALVIFFEAIWQQGVRFVPKPWTLKAQIEILKDDLKKIPGAWKGILASIISTSGIVAYMVYLYQIVGDPLAFLHSQAGFGRTIGFDWVSRLIQNTLTMYKITGNPFYGEISNFDSLIEPLATIVIFPLVILVFIKFRPSFGLFTMFSFFLPLATGVTTSMQRFVLTFIPCFILLAVWGKRPWVDRLIIGFSLPLQAYLLILFTHWYWAG